ncbi:MAG TPA: hypothetical protein VLM05_17880 [Mycobacteriales bacterium]|nr:hypothetical protein [Mycobacteriales bacterium]
MRRIAAAVLLGLLAAGCADAGSGSGGPPPPPPVATSTPPHPQPQPLPTEGPITVDGVVEKGVEPGCLVLKAGTKSYLLQGAQASSAPLAVPVRVSGELVTNVASYCQQGAPLQVSSISRR